jgi:putative endonuclease
VWTVYIIQTEDGKLYTGITTDLKRRFAEHQASTKGARFFHLTAPLKVAYQETHPTRSAASKRESAIKKLTRAEKLILMDSQSEPSSGEPGTLCRPL